MGIVRKVDVDNLSADQIANLSEQLGQKLSEIINKAAEEARILTKIYGMDIQLGYKLFDLKEINEIK